MSGTYRKGDAQDREVAKFIAGCRDKGKNYVEIVEILNTTKLLSPNGKPWTMTTFPSFVHSRKRMINNFMQNEEFKVPTRKKRGGSRRVERAAPKSEAPKKTTGIQRDTILHILTDPNLNDSKRVKVLVEYLR